MLTLVSGTRSVRRCLSGAPLSTNGRISSILALKRPVMIMNL